MNDNLLKKTIRGLEYSLIGLILLGILTYPYISMFALHLSLSEPTNGTLVVLCLIVQGMLALITIIFVLTDLHNWAWNTPSKRRQPNEAYKESK